MRGIGVSVRADSFIEDLRLRTLEGSSSVKQQTLEPNPA